MLTQKLTSLILFPFIYLSNDTIKNIYLDNIYKMYLPLIQEKEEKIKKGKTIDLLLSIEKALNDFISDNKTTLIRKERLFLKALKQLIKQLVRYLKNQKGENFSGMLYSLTEKELQLGILELAEVKKYNSKIILLDKPYIFGYKLSIPGKGKKKIIKTKK